MSGCKVVIMAAMQRVLDLIGGSIPVFEMEG